MTPDRKASLREVAGNFGTPTYAYMLDDIVARVGELDRAFEGHFKVSYAAKSNPNPVLLCELSGLVDLLDVSSGGEIELGIAAGWSPDRISFTGPAKTDGELRTAIETGIAHVIVESVAEAHRLSAMAADSGTEAAVLLRIAPEHVPKGFGAHMSGRATQFGIAEEDAEPALAAILGLPALKVEGFHVYAGTQCLEATSIVENYRNIAAIFKRLANRLPEPPRQLIFGSGLGVPYHAGQQPVDLAAVGRETVDLLTGLKEALGEATTEMVLETGRYVVGEAGYYLTRVIEVKETRGRKIAICDGGMNHHLAASGNLGSVIHRNYPFSALTAADPAAEPESYTVVGPLCTMIDTLAQAVELPPLAAGDVLAIGASGAYGLTTSPIHFISHAAPREILVKHEGDAPRYADISVLKAGPAAWVDALEQGVS